MARRVTVGPQNVNPFVKFGTFISVFRRDRTNICSCRAVVYTFQVWWIVTGDVLREAPSFWRRSLWRWHISCMWRHVVWHVYSDVGAYSFRVRKSSLLLWSCKHKFLRNIGNFLPGFTVSQISPPLLCRFSATEGKAWQTVITIQILLVEIRIWDLWNAKHPLQTVNAATFRKGQMSEIPYHYAC